MKKVLVAVLFLLLTFTSCAVIHALLDDDKCIYPGCEKTTVSNCSYCIDHCHQGDYHLPSDFNAKTKKSIDKQLEDYRRRNGTM